MSVPVTTNEVTYKGELPTLNESTTLINSKVQIKVTETKGTLFSSFFNLTNTTVGGGTLTLPIAIRHCGLVLGVLLMLSIGVLAVYTFHCILAASEKTNKFTNKEIYEENLGRFSYLLEIFYFSLCFGGICMYLNIVSTSSSLQLQQWFGKILVTDIRVVSCILLVFFIIPLCLFKDISYLGFTSSFSIISIIIVVFVIIYKFIEKAIGNGIKIQNLVYFNVDSFDSFALIFSSIGGFFFSYISQYNVVPIYKELKERSKLKMTGIIWSSMATCTFIYLASAILGYFIFLERDLSSLKGNVLDNFDQSDVLVSIAKFLVILVILFSYPVIHFTARGSLMNMIPSTKTTPFASEIITLLLCGGSFVIGIGIPDVILLMNLSVSVSGLLGCFCFPLILNMIQFKNWWSRILNSVLILIVFAISMFSFVQSVLDLVKYFK
jgi:solute carrier family 38 (sodium-coupled neutral amino acid transporter), member 2